MTEVSIFFDEDDSYQDQPLAEYLMQLFHASQNKRCNDFFGNDGIWA